METTVSSLSICYQRETCAELIFSEEEDPDDYPFPLTLKTKSPKTSEPTSPAPMMSINGTQT